MNKLLQMLGLGRRGDKPEPAAPVPDQRRNPEPTPEQDADELRRDVLRKDDDRLEERDDSPRSNYEP